MKGEGGEREREGGREGGRERETECFPFFVYQGTSQSTGGGASAQTQKREKKPKMTDAEVVAHLSKLSGV